MKRSSLLVLVVAIAVAGSSAAQSVVSEADREAIRGVPDRWGFSLGSYWQTFDTKVRLDASNGSTGTEVNFEVDLQVPKDQANFQVGGYFRFSDRHRVDVSYVSWNRSRTASIERDIQWDDVIFHVGATLDSKASANLFQAIYKYSFVNNGKVAFGLNGGLSALWTEFTLAGEGTVDGGGTASGSYVESESTVFPVPVVGVHFEMTLAERFFWTVEGNFFVASVSGYDGQLTSGGTSLSYYFTRNFGVGAGFATTSYRINKEGDNDGKLRVKYGFGGPIAYAILSF